MENNSIEGESNTLKKPDKHISTLASSFGTEENNWFDAEVSSSKDLNQPPFQFKSFFAWLTRKLLIRSPHDLSELAKPGIMLFTPGTSIPEGSFYKLESDTELLANSNKPSLESNKGADSKDLDVEQPKLQKETSIDSSQHKSSSWDINGPSMSDLEKIYDEHLAQKEISKKNSGEG